MGCSPASHPTHRYITAHQSSYMEYEETQPLLPIPKEGGGKCHGDQDCGQGHCTHGLCHCQSDFVGLHCFVSVFFFSFFSFFFRQESIIRILISIVIIN